MKALTALALMLASPMAFAAVNLSVDKLVDLVVWLLIAAAFYWLAKWLVGEIAPEPPFDKIIKIVMAIIVFVIVLNALLSVAGSPLISFR